MAVVVSFLAWVYVMNQWSLLFTVHRKPAFELNTEVLLPRFPFETSSSEDSTSMLRTTKKSIGAEAVVTASPTAKTVGDATVVAARHVQQEEMRSDANANGIDPTNHLDVLHGKMNEHNELIHRAFFGLGHRLHRSAAAWHLAKSLGDVTHFRFHWESCSASSGGGGTADDQPQQQSSEVGHEEVDYNIFRYLFGNDVWIVPSHHQHDLDDYHHPSALSTMSQLNTTGDRLLFPFPRKMILIRNDVSGYVKGQLYKDLQLPVEATRTTAAGGEASSSGLPSTPSSLLRGTLGPFGEKLASDVKFYKLLRERYRHGHEVDEFMRDHQFRDRFVVGLHLRAGNGEGMHFEGSGRRIANETEFVLNLVKVIGKFVGTEDGTKRNSGRFLLPPLLFLATDTANLIPVVQDASRRLSVVIETVILPQHRLEANAGVTFSALEGAGQKCLEGWRAMASDMMLLSHADAVVAAKHSTFTQSLPLALVLDQERPFCEASETAEVMTCATNMEAWLFRHRDEKLATYSAFDSEDGEERDRPMTTVSPHMVTLLLPDVAKPPEFGQARTFLTETWNGPSSEAIFRYGRSKFDRKYRTAKPGGESKWNLRLARSHIT
jgi:hypothetical protein